MILSKVARQAESKTNLLIQTAALKSANITLILSQLFQCTKLIIFWKFLLCQTHSKNLGKITESKTHPSFFLAWRYTIWFWTFLIIFWSQPLIVFTFLDTNYESRQTSVGKVHAMAISDILLHKFNENY